MPPSKNVWKCQRGLGHRDTGGHGWGGPWSSLISPQGPPFLCPAGTAEAWVCVPMLDPHSAGMPALITTHLDGNKGDACLGGLLSCQHQGNATQSPCTACRAPRPASHRLVALGAPCSQAEEAAHCGPAWIPFLSASITYEGPETPSVLVPDTLKGKGAQGLLAAGRSPQPYPSSPLVHLFSEPTAWPGGRYLRGRRDSQASGLRERLLELEESWGPQGKGQTAEPPALGTWAVSRERERDEHWTRSQELRLQCCERPSPGPGSLEGQLRGRASLEGWGLTGQG